MYKLQRVQTPEIQLRLIRENFEKYHFWIAYFKICHFKNRFAAYVTFDNEFPFFFFSQMRRWNMAAGKHEFVNPDMGRVRGYVSWVFYVKDHQLEIINKSLKLVHSYDHSGILSEAHEKYHNKSQKLSQIP